jgi:hypothetical protein
MYFWARDQTGPEGRSRIDRDLLHRTDIDVQFRDLCKNRIVVLVRCNIPRGYSEGLLAHNGSKSVDAEESCDELIEKRPGEQAGKDLVTFARAAMSRPSR